MIPEQLKKERFVRVLPRQKRAFEEDWQNTKNYSFDEIQPYIKQGENYGVLCGSVRALDDDTSNKDLHQLFVDIFGLSFQVRGHIYFRFDNAHEQKIVFHSEDGVHLGELQGKNSYVIGAGSIHPSGEYYEIIRDLPIITISYDKFMSVFSKFVKSKRTEVPLEIKKTDFNGDKVQDIPIGNIISLGSLKHQGGSIYQGAHPQHGSSTGMNFRVDTSKNTWYCFRDGSGGGSAELIGVMEGIISCSDAGRNCFTPEQGREVIRIARDKYGLKTPELITSRKPIVNVEKMAQRHKVMHCEKGHLIQFNNERGLWRCACCSPEQWHTINDFVELIKKSRSSAVTTCDVEEERETSPLPISNKRK